MIIVAILKSVNSNLRNNALFLLLLTTVLTGCATSSGPAYNDYRRPAVNYQNTQTPQQQLIDKANQYLAQAQTAPAAQQAIYRLNAAELFIEANQLLQAMQTKQQVNRSYLSQADQVRYEILGAHELYNGGLYQQCLEYLNNLIEQRLTRKAYTDILLLMSSAQYALGQKAFAISSLIYREPYLNTDKRSNNLRRIWNIIDSMQQSELVIAKETATDPALIRWLELALNSRQSRNLYANRGAGYASPAQWGQPINASGIPQTKYQIKPEWNSQSPRNIAILLPLSSKFGRAAQAVYDGITFADNENTSPFKPNIQIYDIGEEPELAYTYQKLAIRNGADFIIGPLGKDAANNLIKRGNDSTPTLLLGGDAPMQNSNFNRFSLSPEAEAREVADRNFKMGHITAAIIAPRSQWGARFTNSFARQWLALGGIISSQVYYDDTAFDHAADIKQLFSIQDSQQRFLDLSGVLQMRPKFTPRRRQDIDFVYLVAKQETARVIRPQLSFHHGHNLPVYSTSSIYYGKHDETNNKDLNDTIFPTMPWFMSKEDNSYFIEALNHLYALGMDSYSLAASANQLRYNQQSAIAGNTGILSLDEFGEVLHEPVWAKMVYGKARKDRSKPKATPAVENTYLQQQIKQQYQQQSYLQQQQYQQPSSEPLYPLNTQQQGSSSDENKNYETKTWGRWKSNRKVSP